MFTPRINSFLRQPRIRFATLFGSSFFLFIVGCIAMAGQGHPTSPKSEQADKIDPQNSAACMDCHTEAQDHILAVDAKALRKSPHKELKCQDCHSSFDSVPHTEEMKKDKVTCGKCHSEQEDAFRLSSHSHIDKNKGDHPTCVRCHSIAGPHAVTAVKELSRAGKATLCSNCHEQKERMARYGVDDDAVASYNESFHGKAVLKFGNLKAAICVDCHGAHGVIPPEDLKAPTNRANAAHLCSKPSCHPGANVTFAMSGANHLKLMVKRGPILQLVDIFFRVLTGGMILFLTGGVALDLRKKVFGKEPPRNGRVPALLTSLSFLGMVTALITAAFGQVLSATYFFGGSMVVLILGYLIFLATKAKELREEKALAHYQRFDKVHKWQHIFLMVGFVLLIATGLPLRFAQVDVLHRHYASIGGLDGARFIHRIGAIGLILVWCWHVIDLLFRWKKQGFKFSALTMLPNKKDVKDFVATSMSYVGLSKEEPRYDRFQFRQKMDYLSEYWGVPVMVLTGFVLWFPIYWGNRLPEQAVAIAVVAHGWEATLAFSAIIMWHMYNEHFTPDHFPMSKVWLTGTLTREEMEREHPVELDRIDGQETTPADPE